MKRCLLPLVALVCANFAHARPLVIEQPQQIPFVWDWVALSGDRALSVVKSTDPADVPGTIRYATNLYRRDSAGQWVFDQTLVMTTDTREIQRPAVAMNGSLLAAALPGGIRIFAHTNEGWIQQSRLDLRPVPTGRQLDISGEDILTTGAECSGYASLLRRNSSGRFAEALILPVATPTCITALDFDGTRAIVSSYGNADGSESAHVRIFELDGGPNSIPATDFAATGGNKQLFGAAVAIHGDLALASTGTGGAYVYRRGPTGWVEAGRLDDPDGGPYDTDASIQINDKYILTVSGMLNRSTGAGYLYRERADHTFEHLADLVGTRENPLSLAFLEGERVIGLAGDFGNTPLEFNLPVSFAVPALVQDDFESGAGAWTSLPGSDFAIASNGATHVFRQSSLTGDAGAVGAADMTDQSISADVRLNAVNGDDRWAGLMTRFTSDANYYYVTLRDSNRVVLKRMAGGVFTELASYPLDIAPGHTYRVTLESVGTHHAVDVDGQRVIRFYDAAHSHGRPGLRMYKASADFDNVVVTPGPVSNLIYAANEKLGGNWTGTPTSFAQTSTSAAARRTSGVPREDAVVQAVVTVDSFSGNGSPWVGLMARYRDAGNYYYVTARKTNELSLRRLVDGEITVLGTVPLTVTPGVPFVLRLEAVGDRLRAYVNDELRLEQANADIVAGKVGAMTYRAAGKFAAYTAYEP